MRMLFPSSYKSTIRLVGGRGGCHRDNLAHFNLELEKDLAGRDPQGHQRIHLQTG